MRFGSFRHATSFGSTSRTAFHPQPAAGFVRIYRWMLQLISAGAPSGGVFRGDDPSIRNDEVRVRLRKQAIPWLCADLAHWTKQAQSSEPAGRALAQKTLKHWQVDTDLVGLRESAANAILPGKEGEACRKLWADVADVLKVADK